MGFLDFLGGFFGRSYGSAGGDGRDNDYLTRDNVGDGWVNDAGDRREMSTTDLWATEAQEARDREQRDSSALSWGNSSSSDDQNNNRSMYSDD